jgi:replicative DNA helicase
MSENVKFSKVAPQSIEAEQSVLGSMILDRDMIAIVLETLEPRHFYAEKHGEIYRAVLELYEANEPVDMVTLVELLSKKGLLDRVGGPAYLSALVEGVPTPEHAPSYAKLVAQKAMLRDLIKTGNEIVRMSYDEEETPDEIVSEAERLLYDMSQGRAFKDITPLKEELKKAFEIIDRKYQNRGEVSGLPTGFDDLNKLTGGFQKSDLIILAARPGMGKTSLALNFAEHIAVDNNTGVGIFTLEMSATQLVTRILCARSEVDALALREGWLRDDDWHRLSMASEQLHNVPICIVDSPGLTPLELRAKARRMQKEFGVELIIVDYLQLMSMPGKWSDSRVQQISEMTRQLKMMARELNVPVMVLSQLSRAVETREKDIKKKRPQLSDLRESGSIEQDADLVMFLFREGYYLELTQSGAESVQFDESDAQKVDPLKTELILAKHRNGPTGKVFLTFRKEYTRFENASSREEY